MKIDNINVHFITNVNSTVRKLPADKIKFYACYRLFEDNATQYIGTFDKEQLWVTLKRRYPNEYVKIKAYARQTDARRGRDGKYRMAIWHTRSVEYKFYKNKKDAMHIARRQMKYGYVQRIIVINEYGEILFDERKPTKRYQLRIYADYLVVEHYEFDTLEEAIQKGETMMKSESWIDDFDIFDIGTNKFVY